MKILFNNKTFLATALAISLHITSASASVVYSQGFETDTTGWLGESSGWFGNVTRTASGDNGIDAFEGDFYAQLEGDSSTAPLTTFDEYRDVFPGEYSAQIAIYLDTSWALGTGFDYLVSSNGSDGIRQRDFFFNVTKDSSTGGLLVGGSNSAKFTLNENLENLNHFAIQDNGWYIFEHLFRNDGGILAVDLNLKDALGSILFTETLSNSADTIPTEVGGNRYGWFTTINVENGIAVDASQLAFSEVPAPASFALMLVGLTGLFRLKRRA